MESNNIQVKVLTRDEMVAIKGAGPDPGYIGPAIEPGEQDKVRNQSFLGSLVAFFSFDFNAFFGTTD